jgi:hypothetical protein
MDVPAYRVAEFRQRGFVAAAGTDVQYGMCVGFSAAWVIRHRTHKSEGPEKRCAHMKVGSSTNAENIQRAYLRGRTRQDSPLSTGQSGAINAGFASASSGISIVKTDRTFYEGGEDSEALQSIFVHTAGIHNYYVIMLSFGDSRLSIDADNHAIAGYHSNGKFRGWGSHLYIFEPNFGEFKLSGSEVKGFFKQISNAYLNYKTKEGVLSSKKLRLVTIHALSLP